MGAIIGAAYAFLGNTSKTEKFIRNLIDSAAFKKLDIQIFSTVNHDQTTQHLDYYLNNLKKYFSLLKTVNRTAIYDEKMVNEIGSLLEEMKKQREISLNANFVLMERADRLTSAQLIWTKKMTETISLVDRLFEGIKLERVEHDLFIKGSYCLGLFILGVLSTLLALHLFN